MRFENIDLKNKKPLDMVKALVCQFRFDESDWAYDERDLLKLVNESRIQDYLDHISVAISNYNANLIVLPELSTPNSLLTRLQMISKQTSIIIVGGSQYYEENGKIISRCPVIINGIIYYTDKINPSPLEKSPIKGHGLASGETIRIFQNTSIGNFAVIICADYLDRKIRTKLASYGLDFIIIIAFQKDSGDYHNRMNVDCGESQFGSYFLYSNVSCSTWADGRSGLFAIMDRIFSSKIFRSGWSDGDPETKLIELRADEKIGYFVVDIDVRNKRPSLVRNIYTKPNISISSKDESAKEYEEIEDKRKRLRLMEENITKRRS